MLQATIKRIHSQSKKPKYLLMPDITTLVQQVFQSNPPNGQLTQILVLQIRLQTMMRSVDCAHIMWGAFTYNGHTFIKCTDKNASIKIFNISPPTLTLLHRYLNHYKDQPAPYLFRHHVNPHLCLGAERLAKLAKQFMEKSGIYTDIFKSHSLRGAVATHLLKQGLDIHWVQERGGWSSLTTLQQHYNRLQLDQNWAALLQGTPVPNHHLDQNVDEHHSMGGAPPMAPHEAAKGEDAEVSNRHFVAAVPPLPTRKTACLKATKEAEKEAGDKEEGGGHSNHHRPWHPQRDVHDTGMPIMQQGDGNGSNLPMSQVPEHVSCQMLGLGI